jgi:hypothetical protein
MPAQGRPVVAATQLHPAYVRQVMRALGQRLKALTGRHHSAFTLHASVPVYHLAASAFKDAGARLGDGTSAVFTGRVHHHVEDQYTGERLSAATEVASDARNIGPVRSVFVSSLNDKIVDALRVIADVPDVHDTRLLVAPRFYLTGLWLSRRDEDLVFLVDAMPEFPLSPGELYSDVSLIRAAQSLMPQAKHADDQ